MKKIFSLFILFFLSLILYHQWFDLNKIITAGDWNYTYPEQLVNFFNFPRLWQPTLQNGLGGSWVYSFNNYPLHFLTSLGLSVFHMNSSFSPKIFWIFPVIIIPLVSSYYLSWILFKNHLISFFSSIIFSFNTPLLLLIAGGQFPIAVAYGFTPLIFAIYLKCLEKPSFYLFSILSILIFLSSVYEIRITGITVVLLFIFFVYRIILMRKINMKEVEMIIFLIFLSCLLSSYWILPMIFAHKPGLQAVAGNVSVDFLSWADFSYTLSLFHPFWPENIFGKVHFLQPEFLLLPVLAFSSLLFVNKKKLEKYRYIIFFALLGLISAFLAKGTKPPFGEIYSFLYSNVPGFSLFRDSSKFNILVAFSYSILIPFSIYETYRFLSSKFKIQNYLPKIFLFICFAYLIFLIRPAILNQLPGTFKASSIPEHYIEFSNFIKKDNNFSRILWIPQWNRYGFYSNIHPAVSANELFSKDNCKRSNSCSFVPTGKDLFSYLNSDNLQQHLLQLQIKYIVVPVDTDKSIEVFLTDRKPDSKKRNDLIKRLDAINWLSRKDFGEIKVYSVNGKFNKSANEDLYYMKVLNDQKWVNIGAILSSISFVLTISFLAYTFKRKL